MVQIQIWCFSYFTTKKKSPQNKHKMPWAGQWAPVHKLHFLPPHLPMGQASPTSMPHIAVEKASHTRHTSEGQESPELVLPNHAAWAPSTRHANHLAARPACPVPPCMSAHNLGPLFANWDLGGMQRGCGVGWTWATSPWRHHFTSLSLGSFRNGCHVSKIGF